MLQAVVVPHPHLMADEQRFHDLHKDPVTLSEPGYDLFLQDVCLAITAKLQFSSVQEQQETAIMYWHQDPPLVPDAPPYRGAKNRRHKKKSCYYKF